MNVGQDTAGSNGDVSEELVEFFVVLDGERNVARNDSALLVVSGGVASEFENLGTEIFQDGGEVDGGSGAHASGVLAVRR